MLNAQKQVDNVVRSCNLEKSNLEARLRYKNLLVLGLSVLVCILLLITAAYPFSDKFAHIGEPAGS